MERVRAFRHGGRDIVELNLAGLHDGEGFDAFVEQAKREIGRYPAQSLLTLTNAGGVMFDTGIKNLIAAWMAANGPIVLAGAVYGYDSVTKEMAKAVFRQSGRTNMRFCASHAEALDWLLEQR